MKKRLDMLMMERALAPSREKAKAFIMAGDVYVDGQKEDKAGTMFPETVAMKKLLRLEQDSGMQEKQKNYCTGSRELTQSCSRIWTLQAWKKIS